MKNKIISIKANDKSLKNFEWDELPDFAVITGVNGSGKTQLLDFIAANHQNSGQIQYQDNKKIRIYTTPHYQKVYVKPLMDETLRKSAEVDEIKIKRSVNLKNIRGNGEVTIAARADGVFLIMRGQQTTQVQISNEMRDCVNAIYNYEESPEDQKLLLDFFSLTHDQIDEYIRDKFVDDNKIQSLGISNLFLDYEKGKKDLESDGFREKVPNEQQEEWLKSKLKEKYQIEKSPWETINELLLQYGFSHRVKAPNGIGGYELAFEGDENIKFVNLSSGEQVIFHLICSAYQGSGGIKNNSVFLMDEFDAHLNPNMSKMFIEIVQNIFVKDFGIQVIMTTHSPSTAAYVPEENLFWMEDGKILLQNNKKEKMEIVRELSSGFLCGFEKLEEGYALTYFTDPTKKYYLFFEGWCDVLHFKSACKKFNDEHYQDILKKCNLMPMRGVGNPNFVSSMIDNFYHDKKICEKIIAVFDNDDAGQKCLKKVKEKFDEIEYPTIMLKNLPEDDIERMYDKSLLKDYFKTDSDTGELKIDNKKLIGKSKELQEAKAEFAKASSGFESEDFKNFKPILDEILKHICKQDTDS